MNKQTSEWLLECWGNGDWGKIVNWVISGPSPRHTAEVVRFMADLLDEDNSQARRFARRLVKEATQFEEEVSGAMDSLFKGHHRKARRQYLSLSSKWGVGVELSGLGAAIDRYDLLGK